MIKNFEGFRAKAYKDVNSLSIGYGHRITNEDPSLYTATITEEQGSALLDRDLKTMFEPELDRQLKVTLLQIQYDACISLIYNCGLTQLIKSGIFNLINIGKLQEAANTFLILDKGGKVLKRRQEERELFLTGTYP